MNSVKTTPPHSSTHTAQERRSREISTNQVEIRPSQFNRTAEAAAAEPALFSNNTHIVYNGFKISPSRSHLFSSSRSLLLRVYYH